MFYASLNSTAKNIITTIQDDASLLLNDNEALYVNFVVGRLQEEGLWDKIKALYGFVGGTAETHRWNWKTMLDTDAAFRLSFLGGGWVHSSIGAKPNGTSSYADTFYIVPYVDQIAPDMAIGYSTNENTANISNESVMGDRSTASQCRLIIKRSNNLGYSLITQSLLIAGKQYTMPSDIRGLSIANKLSSDNSLYLNGVKPINEIEVDQGTSENMNSIKIGGVPFSNPQFTDKRCNLAFISSEGLTDQEARIMSNIVTTAQKILNRA